MVAYNFQEQFADDVEAGKKLQTMRSGAARCKVGDTLQLYTGQRTPACRLLNEGECILSIRVRMKFAKSIQHDKIWANRSQLHWSDYGVFAAADGFKSYLSMRAWFMNQYGNKFTGNLTRWKIRTCRNCKCTHTKACVKDGIGCHWVEKDLCSSCA